MRDVMRPYVPDFKGTVNGDEQEDCTLHSSQRKHRNKFMFYFQLNIFSFKIFWVIFTSHVVWWTARLASEPISKKNCWKPKRNRNWERWDWKKIFAGMQFDWSVFSLGHVWKDDSNRSERANRRGAPCERRHKTSIHGKTCKCQSHFVEKLIISLQNKRFGVKLFRVQPILAFELKESRKTIWSRKTLRRSSREKRLWICSKSSAAGTRMPWWVCDQ